VPDRAALPSIERLDELDPEAFAGALAPLFEGAPRFLARLAAKRPFGSYRRLLDTAASVAVTMPEDEQVELIDSHPRIGAHPAAISRLSFREQGYDREAAGDDGERRRLQEALERLNSAYEARFGFRFVVFVGGRSRGEIVPIMEQRLGADRDAERRRAIGDVVAIAEDRVRRLRPAEPLEEDR
jgi:OHCU decarboxylase